MSESNPYSAPAASGTAENHYGRLPGKWVRQVRVVATLMIVQGVFEFVYGLYLFGMGFWFPKMMAVQQGAGPPMPPEAEQFMTLYFVISGGFCLLVGLFRIFAGILGFNFKAQMLGIVSHFLGLLLIVSCYCVLTGVPLAIYGCLVYFNREVTFAFQLRSQGQSVPEIIAKFY